MKKTIIINGNPNLDSLSMAIAEKYRKSAKNAGHNSEVLHLNKLSFDPILKGGRIDTGQLEPDIQKAQQSIKKADHLVFVFPIWWGTYPALLKGFIDRTFLSGFAYEYDKSTKKLNKLLKGKTARLVVTMDTPSWYYALFYKNLGIRALKQGLLQYCGVTPVKTTVFSPVRTSTQEQRKSWLSKVEQLGNQSI